MRAVSNFCGSLPRVRGERCLLGVAALLLACSCSARMVSNPAGELASAGTCDAGKGSSADSVPVKLVSGGAQGEGAAAPPGQWLLPEDAGLASCVSSKWTVSASGSAEGNPPEHAVDGEPVTFWSTGVGQGPGQYLELGFGGWVTLSRLALENSGGNAGDYLRGFELLASRDGVTFTRLLASGTQSLQPQGGIQIIEFYPTPLRALRINSTLASGNRWSVHELNLDCYGRDEGTTGDDPLLCDDPAQVNDGASGNSAGGAGGAAAKDPLDRKNWSATASSTGDLDSPDAAFDANLTTRWSSGVPQASGDWFQLDLGAVACIGSLWIASASDEYPSAYTVEVSKDAINYVRVAEEQGSAIAELRFRPHSARFVRINQLAASGANWWSIRELKVGS
jgi:hypothetical protein